MGKTHHQMVHHRTSIWIALVAYLLTGCATPPPVPQVRVIDNPEKDKYIAKVELEVSEASAALKVAKDAVQPPHSKLVDLTIIRLDGIKPPTQKQVDYFKSTLTDDKQLKKAEDKASKVEADTDALIGLIDMVQIENEALKQENDAILKEKAFGELRSKCFMLGSWFAIGGVLLLIGSNMLGMSKRNGLSLLAASVFFFACPFMIKDVVESVWFKVGVGLLIGFSAVAFLAEAYLHHNEVSRRLTSGGHKPS